MLSVVHFQIKFYCTEFMILMVMLSVILSTSKLSLKFSIYFYFSILSCLCLFIYKGLPMKLIHKFQQTIAVLFQSYQYFEIYYCGLQKSYGSKTKHCITVV